MKIQKRNLGLFFLAPALVLVGTLVIPTDSSAQSSSEKCEFTRDLEVGVTGEDVRCLQKFLNANGFQVADAGVGSPGNETDTFKDKTKDAVARWQASKGMPSSGYFGTLSRAAYTAQLTPAPAPTPVVIQPSVPESVQVAQPSSEERRARSTIKKVRDLMKDVEDAVDDAEDDGDDVAVSRKLIDKAEDKIVDSLYAFIDQDFSEAITLAERAENYLDDVKEDVGGDKDDAKEAIDDADEAVDDAKDEIDEADDDDEDVEEAEDIIDDAKAKLKKAKNAFEDEEYDDAIDYAKDAEDLARDAVDAIGN